MKKYYLTLLTSLLIYLTNAQITLKRSDFPKLWDKYAYAYDTNFMSKTPAGIGGANQKWDFTNILTSAFTDTVFYTNAADHPDKTTYPEANLVSSSTFDGETFLKIDSSGTWVYNSFPLDTSGKTSIIKMKIAQFPLNYLDSFTDSFQFQQSMKIDTIPFVDSVRFSITTLFTNTVDAWGELKIPGKTANCLRLKTVIEPKTKIEIHIKLTNTWTKAPIPGLDFGPEKQTSYRFLGQGEGDYLMQAEVDSNNDIVTASYRIYSNTNIQTPQLNSILIFPNPAEKHISIISKEKYTMNIFNIEGKIVKSEINLFEGINNIDISNLESGLYFYKGMNINGNIIEGKFNKIN